MSVDSTLQVLEKILRSFSGEVKYIEVFRGHQRSHFSCLEKSEHHFGPGDGNEVFIDLQKNDDSYGIPHGTLNKKQTSNQRDSPHLPEFSNKTNLSIRIDLTSSLDLIISRTMKVLI